MNSRPHDRLLLARRLCGALFLLLAAAGAALAAEPAPPPAATEPLPPPAMTSADLEAFLDPLLEGQLARRKIAGAVVSVVKDGAILFAKGYGFADVAGQRPMTADATLVRPGSISKLFTAIAVMQQVEAGTLDLDRDVNAYLDFAVPTPPGGVPVTLRRLLTHRAGFEEHIKDLFARDGAPEPLGRWLARSLPRRIFPVGDVPAYSNYGLALAGYIVARVSGEPYESYVERHILAPLGMAHSSFRQPLPAELAPLLSRGYHGADAPPLSFAELIQMVPAGGLSASAADIGRFMLALLGGGALDGARLLGPAALAEMMAPQSQGFVDEMGLVFYRQHLAGLHLIGHDGETIAFNSKLLLLPEARFGLFVSYNSGTAAGVLPAADVVLRRVLERYFPQSPVAGAAAAPTPPAVSYAGIYQSSRRGESSFIKLAALLNQTRVRALPDGTIGLTAALSSEPPRTLLAPAAAGVFRFPSGTELGFVARSDGMRFQIGPPLLEWQRVPWYLDVRVVAAALGLSLFAMAAALVSWPLAAIFRRRRGRRFGRIRRDRAQHALVRLVLAIDLATVGAVALLWRRSQDPTIFSVALDPWLTALYALGWLVVLGAAAVAVVALGFWRQRIGGLWTRLHHTVLALAAVLFALCCLNWHIAGTTWNY